MSTSQAKWIDLNSVVPVTWREIGSVAALQYVDKLLNAGRVVGAVTFSAYAERLSDRNW